MPKRKNISTLNNYITFTNTLISLTKDAHITACTKGQVKS
jgi:hypothetical protein